MSDREHEIAVPAFYWSFIDDSPETFKNYVIAYLKRNHPGLKPVRVKRPYSVVCIKDEKG